MNEVVRKAERGQLAAIWVVVSALTILSIAATAGYPLKVIAPALALTLVSGMAYRSILVWRNLLVLLVLLVLFIPIRRYTLPGNLPFQLEPYRLFVVFLMLAWLSALLVDSRIRIRRSGFEGPFILIVIAALGSEIGNPARFNAESTYAVKQLSFFLSFILVFYLVVSVARRSDDLERLVFVLVTGGAIVALFTVIESRTNFNVFDHLTTVMPFLREAPAPYVANDGRGLRAVASAQHPIALGAALVLLMPLAIYLAQTKGQRRWGFVAGLLALGALTTLSRTAVLMLFVVGFVFLFLRPIETKRIWPILLPALVAVHIAAPGTLGTIKNSFFPKGGIVAEQDYGKGTRGSGRLADLGPSIQEWKSEPLVGQGFGTRISSGPSANAAILDDQWLGTLLETGAVGFFAFLWLFIRALRRLFGEAKRDTSDRGWLLTALAASVAAFAVGMFTYDAFAFIQVTFLLFILLGIAASVLALPRRRALT
jgi:O-antigen ligase